MTENQQKIGVLQAQIVAVAMIMSTVVYVIVVLLMKMTGAMGDDGFVGLDSEIMNPLSLMLIAIGSVSAVVAFFMRGAMVARLGKEEDQLPGRMRAMLVSMAISESSSIYGLVLALLGGLSTYVWLLWAIGLSGKILLFPTREWLEPTRME